MYVFTLGCPFQYFQMNDFFCKDITMDTSTRDTPNFSMIFVCLAFLPSRSAVTNEQASCRLYLPVTAGFRWEVSIFSPLRYLPSETAFSPLTLSSLIGMSSLSSDSNLRRTNSCFKWLKSMSREMEDSRAIFRNQNYTSSFRWSSTHPNLGQQPLEPILCLYSARLIRK